MLFSCARTEDKKEKDDNVKFHTQIKGSGSPTIIFESGLGTPLNTWDIIQTGISENYRTIAYDRKGIGGTEAASSPRTIENLANDLHTLISQSEMNGPIVLVGHSLGGHIVRKYQQLYPSRIRGLFLIDPTNEYLYDEVFKQMPREAADSMKNAWEQSYKGGLIGVYNEWKEVYSIDTIMRSCPLPANIPITILVSYQESPFLSSKNTAIKKDLFAEWEKDRKNVNILSTTQSGHYIHHEDPTWVISELEKFLEAIE